MAAKEAQPPRGRADSSGSGFSMASSMGSMTAGLTTRTFHPVGSMLRKAEVEYRMRQEQDLQQLLESRTGFGLFAVHVLHSKNFDVTMGLIICFNVATMVVQANENSACYASEAECERSSFASGLGYFFLAVYSLELVLRLAADRMLFFCSNWNLLDLTVVLTGWMDTTASLLDGSIDMPGFSILRVFRVMRLLRAVRLMRFFPSLAAMITGCMSVMKAMVWGIVLIFLFLIIFSIGTVDLVGPYQQGLGDSSSEWCDTAFSSVYTAVVFFFQIFVAGDSWGACAIPLVLEHWWLFIVFGICFFIVEFGIMNLVLSAIIDCATESHEQDVEQRAAEVRAEKEKAIEKLKNIFHVIDTSGDHHLSSAEMLHAFETNDKVRTIFSLHDICDKDEMRLLFRYMDKDRSDSVSIDEFTTCLRRAMQQDIRMQMMCVKLHLESLQTNVEKGFARMESMIGSVSRGEEAVAPPKTPRDGEADGEAPAGSPAAAKEEPAAAPCRKAAAPEEDGEEAEGDAAAERERHPTAARVAGAREPPAPRSRGAVAGPPPPAQAAGLREEAPQEAPQESPARARLRELEARAAGEEARRRELEARCREARDRRSAAEALLRLASDRRAASEPPAAARREHARGPRPQEAERLCRLAAEAESAASRRLPRHTRGGAPQDAELLRWLAAEARSSADRGWAPPSAAADDGSEGGPAGRRPDAAPGWQQQPRERRQRRPRTPAEAPLAAAPPRPRAPALQQVAQAAQAAQAIQASWHAAAAAPSAGAAPAPPLPLAPQAVGQAAPGTGFGYAPSAAVLAPAGPPLLPSSASPAGGFPLHHGLLAHGGPPRAVHQPAAVQGEAWGLVAR